jgi:3-phosphoshikimate 1-carboxyvinyltransferase
VAFRLDKIVVFGVGLIGGSFALALKQAGGAGEVVGIGRSRATLDEALRLGLIDRIGACDAATLKDADLVLLATPVGQMPALMQAMAPHLGPRTAITDGGSTKSDVVAALRQCLPKHLSHFVPAHPIAGAENSGAAAAKADLYVDRKVVLTPLPENAPEAVERVRAAWAACGATVHEMAPARHDQVFAAVSHLPHLLSFALVHDLAQRENREEFFRFAASGFRDFTRIAASHPEMWRDICIANRTALLGELEQYQRQLEELRRALLAGDAAALEAVFAEARTVRRAWAEGKLSPDGVLDLAPATHASGTVRLPGSKSISNRFLLLAALAEGETAIRDLLLSDDVERMLEALKALGIDWQRGEDNDFIVRGAAGVFPVKQAELFLGNAGTAFRPLTAALALSGGHYRCPACRACTSGRSATWSMPCASSAPTSATSATRASRPWRSARRRSAPAAG